jgi:putative flavoprotein involved in K+ transport
MESVADIKPPVEELTRRFDVVVIGGGQAGLAVGYHLAQRGLRLIILDANQHIGDAWRNRWDSLRLFTPARCDGLPGMPFPALGYTYPTKGAMAAYLESYATRFALPVRTGVKVTGLSRQGDRFTVTAGDLRFEAEQVVVAMGNCQVPWVPSFAQELDPSIIQLHAIEYRNRSQLRDGGVLVVGAGNSGAEIALDVVSGHTTWLSGRDTGHLPFRIEGLTARFIVVPLVLQFLLHRVMTVNTPIGRKVRAKILTHHGMPLVRIKPKDIAAAGVERVSRVVGVQDGLPKLADQRLLEVSNVIWCTGFRPGFSWINLPVFENGEPVHQRGVVASEPWLYFVGLDFLYAASSSMVQGVGRDAAYIANRIAFRASMERRSPEARVAGLAV